MSTAPSKLIEGRTGPWEIVLGLEIHAQVASQSKLFFGRRGRLRRGSE